MQALVRQVVQQLRRQDVTAQNRTVSRIAQMMMSHLLVLRRQKLFQQVMAASQKRAPSGSPP
jgi:hypothetical protein